MSKQFGSPGKQKDADPNTVEAVRASAQAERERIRAADQQVAEIVTCRIVLPHGYCRTDARRVSDTTYRVNVYVERPTEYGKEMLIAKSYFVTMNGAQVAHSVPPLE